MKFPKFKNEEHKDEKENRLLAKEKKVNFGLLSCLMPKIRE